MGRGNGTHQRRTFRFALDEKLKLEDRDGIQAGFLAPKGGRRRATPTASSTFTPPPPTLVIVGWFVTHNKLYGSAAESRCCPLRILVVIGVIKQATTLGSCNIIDVFVRHIRETSPPTSPHSNLEQCPHCSVSIFSKRLRRREG